MSSNSPFNCLNCDFSCATEIALNAHVLNWHADDEVLFRCGTCTINCKTEVELRRHLAQKHNRGMDTRIVTTGAVVEVSDEVEQEQEATPVKVEPTSEEAPKDRQQPSKPKRRSRRKRVRCPDCDFRASSNRTLHVHMERKHKYENWFHERPHFCRRCQYRFNTGKKLALHMKNRHSMKSKNCESDQCNESLYVQYKAASGKETLQDSGLAMDISGNQ